MLNVIWLFFFSRDLSDINKDGNLDLDEFMIAMHLIETVKAGQPVPASLPQNLIPATKKSNEPEPVNDALDIVKKRSESVSSMGKPDAGIFILCSFTEWKFAESNQCINCFAIDEQMLVSSFQLIVEELGHIYSQLEVIPIPKGLGILNFLL